jgi:ComF family protein
MQVLKQRELLRGFGKLPRLALDLVLPPSCPGCRAALADSDALCPRCWSEVRFIEAPVCPIYGTPFAYEMGADIVSAAALADPPPFRRARSAVVYGDVARRLVHQLKYRDRPDLARVLATAMHRAGRDILDDCSVIVPIPLHYFRLWQRRFNQAGVLAQRLSKASGVPFDPLVLQRIRSTPRQVGLTASQREENMRGAFRVPDGMRGRITGRAVLLIDDVYTSGATAKAATRALLRGGAHAVDVLTFARVIN